MEIKTRDYKLNERELLFRPCMRAMIDFERKAGYPVSESKTAEDNLLFIYCGTVAGMKKAGKEFTLTFEGFIDEIDGHFDFMDGLLDFEEDPEKKQ